MKNKIIVIFLMLLMCGTLYSQETDFAKGLEELSERINEAMKKDYVDPELPILEEIEMSRAFSLELYEEADLEEVNASLQNALIVFITYAKFINLYPDEFSFITGRVVRIMEIVVDKSRESQKLDKENWVTMVHGFSQVLEGATVIFTSVGEIPEKNRLEIAEVVLSVANNKWDIITAEKKSSILNTLTEYKESETSKEIRQLVSDFLKDKDFVPKMEKEGI